MSLRQTITLQLGGNRQATRTYVFYDVDRHGHKVMTAVCLPGDLLDITPQLTEQDKQRVSLLLNRQRRKER